MIKLFRKIRQNLLSEGKTGRYLKYAIGEIVLVVIGILIALQINNWNEENKADQFEMIMLKEIKNGFLIDYNTIVFGKIFDPKEDWIGNDHLNEYGARKFTEELVQDLFINEVCGPNIESIEYSK